MKNSLRITTYFFALVLSISLGFVNGNGFDLFTTLIALQTISVVGKLQVQVSHPDKPVSACCN